MDGIGSTFGGRFRLVREIGAGGMGRVYEAIDTSSGRRVAAKVLISNTNARLDALLRFYQEGAVLSTFQHPNIVEVFGTFLEGGSCCIVMELLEGPSLGAILHSQKLSLLRIKTISLQVASALVYAHSQGVAHRDVKPDNIMVIPADHVKVTDFGIARFLGVGRSLSTATGMTIGTPLYMSPEQVEGQTVDGRSDMYSLGAVMYQMVTGRTPFSGDDPLTIAFQVVHKAPPPPSQVANVPADWESLILRLLAKNPEERVPPGGIESAIAALQTGGSVGTQPPRRTVTPPPVVPVDVLPQHPTGSTMHDPLPRSDSATGTGPRDIGNSTPSAPVSSLPAGQPTAGSALRPPTGGMSKVWVSFAVGLALLLAGAGAYLVHARTSPTVVTLATATTTSLPVPSPTSVSVVHPVPATSVPTVIVFATTAPAPTRTGNLAADEAAVRAVVRESNDRWTASMECACDNNLRSVKTGQDLQADLAQVQTLQSKGQRWTIVLNSWNVDSVHVSGNDADQVISKNETRTVLQGNTVVQQCTGPFQVHYHAVKENGTWKVDSVQTVSSNCV